MSIYQKLTLFVLICFGLLCLGGCEPTETWVLKHEPTTPEERKAVAEHVEKILIALPNKVSGDDQDLEDITEATYLEARKSICRPTLWQFKNGNYTGVFKYVEEQKLENK